jgi:hypothetical protein
MASRSLASLFFVGALLGAAPVGADPQPRTGSVGDGSGLQISGAADLVGTFDAGSRLPSSATNRFDAREAELLLFAPVDTLFDGQLSMAAHQEFGTYNFELHELFVASSRLIPRSRIKAGQFFLGVGRLNQVHRHDWPFVSSPKVHREFFGGNHGALDAGLEYGWLLPADFYLDLTVGVTNGWVLGHSHTLGLRPQFPTHYLRLATYADIGDSGGLQVGLNYLGRRDNAGMWTTMLGIDVVAKRREGRRLPFYFQGEVWYRARSDRGGNSDSTLGFYAYPQLGLGDFFSFGLRVDGFVPMAPTSGFEWSLVPTLSYRLSEFSVLRAALTASRGFVGGVETTNSQVAELQAVFILGAHPAHDF